MPTTLTRPKSQTIDQQLIKAVQTGDMTKVRDLLNRGADPNAKDSDWMSKERAPTPLHWAAYDNHIEIAKLLIQNGAKVNAKGSNNITPLGWAAISIGQNAMHPHGVFIETKEKVEMVKLLLDNGALVDAKDDWNATALFGAANCHNPEITKLLISHGAQVNTQDGYGRTALHTVAMGSELEGATKVVEYLLKSGANPNIKDTYGKTPLDYAKEHDNRDISRILERYTK